MNGNIELIVARFQEDLRWLKRVPQTVRVTVYDKSEIGSPAHSGLMHGRARLRPSRLPNVGREAHTYLHHIVTRYDELADITVFCQGKPFDHVSNFHPILRRISDIESRISNFKWLGHIIDRDDRTGSLLFQKWSKNTDGHPLPLEPFWRALWNEPAPEYVTFYPGANFAATSARIRYQPKSFYERALKIACELPDAAHCFERCWDRVFGVDGVPSELIKSGLPVYLKPMKRLTPSGQSQRVMQA